MRHIATTKEPFFQGLPINTGNNGDLACDLIILEKIRERLELMTTKHNKVLFVRFDLHFPDGYEVLDSSQHISIFFKRLVEYYSRQNIDIQYIWVREHSNVSFKQHYHCVLLLDGNKVQNYYPITQKASKIWGHILGHDSSGLVNYCNRIENGLLLRRPSSKATGETLLQQQNHYSQMYDQCFLWASYLAKLNQKTNIPLNMRSFGVSRLL